MKLRQLDQEPKKKLMTTKITLSDYRIIQQKAALYTDGNVSEWIRYAATELLPRPTDLCDAKKED